MMIGEGIDVFCTKKNMGQERKVQLFFDDWTCLFVILQKRPERRRRMCPLWPIHYVFMYLMLLGPIWLCSFRIVGAAAEAATSKNPTTWDVGYNRNASDPILVDSMESIEVRALLYGNSILLLCMHDLCVLKWGYHMIWFFNDDCR